MPRFASFQDIQYIPYTTKDDFRDHYPFGMMAVPMKEAVRIMLPQERLESRRLESIPGRIWISGRIALPGWR